VNFGYLENLLIRNREPAFADTSPLVLVDIKLDADPTTILPGGPGDFELCAEF
jgi:hypothetical protein